MLLPLIFAMGAYVGLTVYLLDTADPPNPAFSDFEGVGDRGHRGLLLAGRPIPTVAAFRRPYTGENRRAALAAVHPRRAGGIRGHPSSGGHARAGSSNPVRRVSTIT
jgi:hypothetical protein